MIDIRAIKVPEGVKFFNKDGNPIDGVAFTLSYKPGTINPKGFPDEAIDYIILNRTDTLEDSVDHIIKHINSFIEFINETN